MNTKLILRFFLGSLISMLMMINFLIPVEITKAQSSPAFSGKIETGLPFAIGETWNFTQNFHGGVNAIDLQTIDGKPGTVVAADDGYVILATQTCAKIQRDDGLILGYQHIEPKDISNLATMMKNNTRVVKGVTVIGKTTGKWTDRAGGCGGVSDGNLVHFWTEPSLQIGSVVGGFTFDGICGKQPALYKDSIKYCPINKITYSAPTSGDLPKGETIDTSKTYALTNVNSNKVLDVLGLSTDDGARVSQWDYNGGPNQQIRFEPVNMGDGRNWYSLKFVHSGKYLVVKQASTKEGAEVFQWTGNGDKNAKWLLISVGNGKYRLQNNKSSLVLAIGASSKENNADLIQWSWLNIADQMWTLRTIDAVLPPPPPSPPTIDPNFIFNSGSSNLWQDQNWGRANLKVCANNLQGNTVYVIFNREGREWKYSQKAEANCVIFWDMDGGGPLNQSTTYYSRAALNQWPSTNWPAPGCAGPTQGQGLCDSIRRP